MNTKYRDNSKFPIRFDRLRDGSKFRIFSEPSRNIYRSKDDTIYTKADNGFYAYSPDDTGCLLMPGDLVMPVVAVK